MKPSPLRLLALCAIGAAAVAVSKGTTRFASIGSLLTGSRSRKFTRAGTYRYVCTLHPGMSGRITVR